MRTYHPITGRAVVRRPATENVQTATLQIVRERLDTAAQALEQVRRMDEAVLIERARWLNWRAWLECTADLSRPFTPYHASSRVQRGLKFSREYRS